MIIKSIFSFLLIPFAFIGSVYYVAIPIVLILSYILVKKNFIINMEENFKVRDYGLLMKKSRKIGFISLIVSIAVLSLLTYFFTGSAMDYLCDGRCSGEGFGDIVFAIGLMGLGIVSVGFIGLVIGDVLTDREIKNIYKANEEIKKKGEK